MNIHRMGEGAIRVSLWTEYDLKVLKVLKALKVVGVRPSAVGSIHLTMVAYCFTYRQRKTPAG